MPHLNLANQASGRSYALKFAKLCAKYLAKSHRLLLYDRAVAIPEQILFLPGASGASEMWAQVASKLQTVDRKNIFGYPGFGGEPQSPDVTSFDDLVAMVKQQLDRPTVIAAQSMGGVIALMVARDLPHLVTHLVLVATSGGVGAITSTVDWRAWVRENLPGLPDWFLTLDIDLTETIRRMAIPTLLIWGDTDEISPVEVGERLQSTLQNATLHIVAGADHDLIQTHAAQVSPIIDQFLLNHL